MTARGGVAMVELRICVDVDDLERAVAFYCAALGLAVRRRLGDDWAELVGATSVLDLIRQRPGTPASPRAAATRMYERHWTPVHVDVTVTDLDAALRRALDAGAILEQEIQVRRWGRMANLADPFGHGFCLLEFKGRGYDELLGG